MIRQAIYFEAETHGPTTAGKIQDQVEGQPGTADVLRSVEVPKGAAEDWPGFVKLVSRMRTAKTTWPAECQLVRQWYEPHLHRMYDDGYLRMADIAQLEQIAAGYGERAPGPAKAARKSEPTTDLAASLLRMGGKQSLRLKNTDKETLFSLSVA